MAFDRLARLHLQDDIRIGDLLVWANAGAYHLSWETRFSHGLAPLVWIDEDGHLDLVRERETFASWWQGWLQ